MNIAIILAGGKGTRMGITDQPKQFIDIYGKPIVIHTLETFDIHSEIDYIAVVCLEEWHDDLRRWLRKFEINKVRWIAPAGTTRQESVFNGLTAIKNDVKQTDIVVIHDSARPLISARIISDNIHGAQSASSVDTVIPTTDTIIRSVDQRVISEIPVRKELFIGQTPQSFKYQEIYEAHLNAQLEGINDATDDCQLILRKGGEVSLVVGERLNFKVTTMEDLLILKSIVKMGKMELI